MTRYDRASRLDHWVGACFSLLVGAAALYVAIQLIESVWVALALILGVIVVVAIGWRIVRYRRNGW